MRISMRLWMVIVLIVVGGFFAHSSFMYLRYSTLDRKINEITSIKNQKIVSCAEIKSRNPLVLLALGQSNAGNHGELAVGNSEFVPLFAERKMPSISCALPGRDRRRRKHMAILTHPFAAAAWFTTSIAFHICGGCHRDRRLDCK